MDSLAAGALRLAAARGDIATLKLLAKSPGFKVDADMAGFTPLMAAVVQGQESAAIWLLQQGASTASRKDDQWGDTLLHYAGEQGAGLPGRLLRLC
jgi:ankyrin repeat protein